MSAWDELKTAISQRDELRAQLIAVLEESDRENNRALRKLDEALTVRDALRTQLAAVEKERDRIQNAMQGVAASHVQIREERDVLAARVAQLEGEAEGARIALGLLGAALLPTKENAASFAKALEWDGSSGGPCTQDAVDILRAIRARAGLDGKEGNRG